MNEKKERMIFDVTYQPQVRTVRDTQRIMLDVIIATLPIVGFGVYRYGWHALLLVVSSMAAAVFFEWGYRKLLHKSITIDDFSAAVTGLLLVMVLPPQTPWWMAVFPNCPVPASEQFHKDVLVSQPQLGRKTLASGHSSISLLSPTVLGTQWAPQILIEWKFCLCSENGHG